MRQGEAKREKLTIENTGDSDLVIKIENTYKDFIRMDSREFTLQRGEKTTLYIEAFAAENTRPDLYLGNLIIYGGSEKKEIPVKIEVESRNPLFDLNVNLVDNRISAGSNISASIEIINIEGIGSVEASITYEVRNYEGNAILNQNEIVSVRNKSELIKEFYIPENTKAGNYELYVYAIYEGKRASGSDGFIIVNYSLLGILAIIVVLIIVLSFTIYFHIKRRRIASAILNRNE